MWFPAIVTSVGRVVQGKCAWEALCETRLPEALSTKSGTNCHVVRRSYAPLRQERRQATAA